jgi:hypothetical protein
MFDVLVLLNIYQYKYIFPNQGSVLIRFQDLAPNVSKVELLAGEDGKSTTESKILCTVCITE